VSSSCTNQAAQRYEFVRIRRQQILTAAAAILASEDTEAWIMKEIADAAGLPLSTLFYHFENMETLLLTLLCSDDQSQVDVE
jgi:AcrR family transcriptional regulator